MRLDSKVFNKVLMIATVSGLIFVLWFSFRMKSSQLVDFENEWLGSSAWKNDFVRMAGSKDSTRLGNIKKPIIIYFWSGWSDLSIQGLKNLSRITPENVTLLAPIVKDTDDALNRVDTLTISKTNFSYGTYWYLIKRVPAVPAFIYIDSLGIISDIHVGFEDVDQLKERLKRIELYEKTDPLN